MAKTNPVKNNILF